MEINELLAKVFRILHFPSTKVDRQIAQHRTLGNDPLHLRLQSYINHYKHFLINEIEISLGWLVAKINA